MGGIRRFFAELIPEEGGVVVLSKEVSHHLLRVVGIAPQEEVELFDGKGCSCRGKLSEVVQGRAAIRVLTTSERKHRRRELHLFAGLLRQQAFSTVLRMSTELGATHIHPVLCERSVARGDKHQRWKKIIGSSVAQSGRSDAPKLYGMCSFEEACGLAAHCRRWVLHPAASESIDSAAQGPVALFIGPEGGFTEHEVECAVGFGWTTARFSAGVFRADTAAAAVLAQFLG